MTHTRSSSRAVLESAVALGLLLLAGPSGARELLYGPEAFTRVKGTPVLARDTFSVAASAPGRLRVLNGGIDGASLPTSSARILLNGAEVVGPRDFKRAVSTFEVPVEIREGTNDVAVEVRGPVGAVLAVEIVTVVPLRPPSEEALDAAQAIHEAIPSARIHFSQLHGGMMWVQSSGRGDFSGDEPFVPKPLAEGRGTGEGELASALLEYLERFEAAYGIDGLAGEMRLVRDPANPDRDPIGEGSDSLVDWRTLELVQTHQGLRIAGHFALGLFDADGNLHAALTRLRATPNLGNPQPSLSPTQALNEIQASLEMIIARAPGLRWLQGLDLEEDVESALELLWVPVRTGADGPLRLAYDVQLRHDLNLALVTLDAHSGEIISVADATPSEWFDDGEVVALHAPDESGADRVIRTTRSGIFWYMGYGNNYIDILGRRFPPGRHVQVGDAAGTTDPSSTPRDPMTILNLFENTWATDSGYIGSKRAASSLFENVHRVLGWWKARGWTSWDGRGSTLWTSINNTRNGQPEKNAWGGGGALQIGAGARAGQTSASSSEVVAHEFMHSVISATTRLRYQDESGAANEALSDLFGVALTGSLFDRLNNDTFGEDSGEVVRNFVAPSLSPFPQPERYSDYLATTRDSGGVHTNSGILNKAHALAIRGGEFRGYVVQPMGVNRPVDMIRVANQLRAFSSESTLEEVAVANSGFCDLLDRLGQAFGSDPITELCVALATAYRATELLPGSNDADVALEAVDPSVGPDYRAPDTRKGIDLEVTNRSGSDTNLRKFVVWLGDELGELIQMTPRDLFSEGCGGLGRSVGFELAPGETKCERITIPVGVVDGYLTRPRNLTATLSPFASQADTDQSNNFVRFRFGSDYTSRSFRIVRTFDDRVRIEGDAYNRVGGFAAISAVFLTRSTSHGPLVPLNDEAEATLGAGRNPSVQETPRYLPSTVIDPIDPALPLGMEIIELPEAKEVPDRFSGPRYQVWFDEAGGLPELDERFQIYVLMDSRQIAEELDETNNLVCDNCRAAGDSNLGVVVRLPLEVPVEALFPPEFQAAAAALPADFPRIIPTGEIVVPRLSDAIEPLGATLPPF